MKLLLKLLILLIWTINTHADNAPFTHISSINSLEKKVIDQEVYTLWRETKGTVKKYLRPPIKSTYSLYNTQIYTHSLLKFSFRNNNYVLIDELLSIYLESLKSLKKGVKSYDFYGLNNPKKYSNNVPFTDKKGHKMWLTGKKHREDMLNITQFLGLVSEALLEVSKIPSNQRSVTMRTFIKQFSPLLDSHYTRWVVGMKVRNNKNKVVSVGPFSRAWASCPKQYTTLTAMDLVNHLISFTNKGDKSYCNAIQDKDLWVMAGVSNYLTAYRYNAKEVKKPKHTNLLQEYLRQSIQLLRLRLSYTKLIDFKRQRALGLSLDIGYWGGYPPFTYSGYTGDSFPSTKDKKASENLGWDLSHARRFLFVFETLYKNKDMLGLSFPTRDTMRLLSNQFLYGAFNKDFRYPLFSNYINGSNGWFRVNQQKGTGYPPSSSGISVIGGGYGLYQNYNSDTNRVMTSLYNILKSPQKDKQNFVRMFYESYSFKNKKRSHSIRLLKSPDTLGKQKLLNFYSSLLIK